MEKKHSIWKKLLLLSAFTISLSPSIYAREWRSMDEFSSASLSILGSAIETLTAGITTVSHALSAEDISKAIQDTEENFRKIEYRRANKHINIHTVPDFDSQKMIIDRLKIIYQKWQSLSFKIALQSARIPECSLETIKLKNIHLLLNELKYYFLRTFLNNFVAPEQDLPPGHFAGIDTNFTQLDLLVDSIRSTPPSSPVPSSPRALPPLVHSTPESTAPRPSKRTTSITQLPLIPALKKQDLNVVTTPPVLRRARKSRATLLTGAASKTAHHRVVTFQEKPSEEIPPEENQETVFASFQTKIIIENNGMIETVLKSLFIPLLQRTEFYNLFLENILASQDDSEPLLRASRNFNHLVARATHTPYDSITPYDIIKYMAKARASSDPIIKHVCSLIARFYKRWNRLLDFYHSTSLSPEETQIAYNEAQSLYEYLTNKGKLIANLIKFTQYIKDIKDRGYDLDRLRAELETYAELGKNPEAINHFLKEKRLSIGLPEDDE